MKGNPVLRPVACILLISCAISFLPASLSAAGIAVAATITNNVGINTASYASQSGFVNIAPGLNTNFGDPAASLITNPLSMPLGLTGAGLLLATSDDGASVNVAESLDAGAYHMRVDAPSGSDIGVADGRMNDVLTFHVAGGGPAQVSYQLILTGSFSGDWYSNSATLSVGGAAFDWQSFFVQNGPAGFGPTTSTFGWDSYTVTNESFTTFIFNGVATVTDSQQAFLTLNQRLECRWGTSCDFSHTLQAGLDLPAGVTVTSESGVFLTAAVPEPASIALLACGLLTIAWRRRGAGNRAGAWVSHSNSR